MSSEEAPPLDGETFAAGAEILAFPAKASRSPEDGGGSGAPPPGDPPPDGDGFDDDDGVDGIVGGMNSEWALVLMGSRAVIMREMPHAPVEDRTRVVSIDAFRAYLSNQTCVIKGRERQPDGSWKTVTRHLKLAPLWLNSRRRRTYDGIEFFPDKDDAAGTRGYFNLWRGYSVTPDPSPAEGRRLKYRTFYDHLATNICDGNPELFRWVWNWFAHILQRPRERIGTAIAMRGKMGTGKTKIGEIMGSLFASHYFLVDDPRYVTGQFNAHMASCLLLQVDEGFWAGDKAAEGRLKGLVTAPKQMIEAKGVDPIRLDNYVRLLFSSNEGWVVPAGMDERRFCVIDVAAHVAQNGQYFAEMDAEMDAGGREALLADLLATDLDAPDAPSLRVIPKTEALLEQKLRSLDTVSAWWFERLCDGAPTRRGSAWRRQVPVDVLFDDYVHHAEKIGVRRKSEKTSLGMLLRKLVPGLGNRKASETIDLGDGTSGVRRVPCWLFPPLADCRTAFVDAVKQPIDWSLYGVADEGAASEEPVPPDEF
ncbi:primase-helicase family protein [Methylocella silvestris]|uniref:NrS-1 polymerase-like helicase domain-containing protein n=1 Tax=Methylocella silvestris TaxID=199596 RepID=A0A2J7TJS7_METSI|nr:primase-helicase family protein [Methylocella silvestris]PNG27019.1 hypothetical protein CR492_04765 [Methylocella silvestris]